MKRLRGWLSKYTRPSGLSASEFAALACAAAAPILWIFSMAMLQSSSGDFPYLIQAAFCLGSGGGMLALARAGSGRKPPNRSIGADIASTCALVCAAMAVPLAPTLPLAASCAAMAVGGLGLAWLVVRCFATCCTFGLASGYRLVLLAFAIAALVRLVLVFVPDQGAFAIAVLLAAAPACAFMVIRWLDEKTVLRFPASPSIPEAAKGTPGHGVREHLPFIGELCLCALMLGLFMGAVGSSGSTAEAAANHLMRLFVALLLLGLFDARVGRRSYRPVQAILVAGAVALVLTALFGGAEIAITVGRATFSLARNFTLLLAYLMALHAAFSGHMGPVVAIGLFRGFYDVFQGIGVLLNLSLHITEIPLFQEPTAIPLVSAVVLLITANRLVIFATHVFGGADPVDAELTAKSCALVGKRFGLTARETELLALICDDASKSDMAQALCVSVNTIRWHCQHIYEKLGVHSKAEAAELVRQETAR